MKSRILILILAAVIPLLMTSQSIEMKIETKIKEHVILNSKQADNEIEYITNQAKIRFLNDDPASKKNGKIKLKTK